MDKKSRLVNNPEDLNRDSQLIFLSILLRPGRTRMMPFHERGSEGLAGGCDVSSEPEDGQEPILEPNERKSVGMFILQSSIGDSR